MVVGLSSGALRVPELKKASRGAGALRAPASARVVFHFRNEFFVFWVSIVCNRLSFLGDFMVYCFLFSVFLSCARGVVAKQLG